MLTLPRKLPPVRESVAGLRPYREGGVRLEAEDWDGRWMIHNYGHGGAGITLAPGSAQLAARELVARVPQGARVAVLGAGIIGLSTAWSLKTLGYGVTVYAKEAPAQTTSCVAGGVWAPVEVNHAWPYGDMLERSYDYYSRAAGGSHVHAHTAYFDGTALAQLEDVPPQLKMEQVDERFWRMQTFLIVTAPHLEQLAQGLTLEQRTFANREDILALATDAWVNCLGAGAGPLMHDSKAIPIRGQLVRMEPIDKWFTVIHETGYLISRPDVFLAGGTFERGVADPTPEEAACRAILEKNQAYLDRFR